MEFTRFKFVILQLFSQCLIPKLKVKFPFTDYEKKLIKLENNLKDEFLYSMSS